MPIAALLLQTKTILISIGQNEEVSSYAHKYVVMQLPVILLSGMNDSQKRFLSCFRKNVFPMVSNVVSTLLYPLWCYYFIIKLEWGAMGCAFADLVGMTITFAANLFYTWTCKDISEATLWWDFDFHDFKA